MFITLATHFRCVEGDEHCTMTIIVGAHSGRDELRIVVQVAAAEPECRIGYEADRF